MTKKKKRCVGWLNSQGGHVWQQHLHSWNKTGLPLHPVVPHFFLFDRALPWAVGDSSSVFKGLRKVFQAELPSVNAGQLEANEDEQKSCLLPCSILGPVGLSMATLTP